MEAYPHITRINTPEEQREVVEAARADNDNMVFPSHVARKDGEIVGAYCMGSIPLLLMWNHTEKMRVRDSIFVRNCADAIMSDRGQPSYFIACNSNSPYYNHMEKFGYHPVWPTNIFWK